MTTDDPVTSPSPAPLTEAEAAAALGLSRIYNRRDDIPFESEPADHADEARAVVAAVRSQIAADALAWVASSPNRWEGYCCHDHMAQVVMEAATEIKAGLDTVDDAAAEAALEDYFRWQVARRLKDERDLILDHRDDLRRNRSRVDHRFTGRLQGLEEAAGMLTTAIKDLSRQSLSLPASKETPSE